MEFIENNVCYYFSKLEHSSRKMEAACTALNKRTLSEQKNAYGYGYYRCVQG